MDFNEASAHAAEATLNEEMEKRPEENVGERVKDTRDTSPMTAK